MSFKQSFSSLNGGKTASCETKAPDRLEPNLCIAESGLWRTIKHNSKSQMRFGLQTVPLFKYFLSLKFCDFYLTLSCFSVQLTAQMQILTQATSSEALAHPYATYMIHIDSFAFDILSVKGITFMRVVTLCGPSNGLWLIL